MNYDTLPTWEAIEYKFSQAKAGGSLPYLKKRGGGVMDIYEILSLLFLGGSFLIALLAYIDRNIKQK